MNEIARWAATGHRLGRHLQVAVLLLGIAAAVPGAAQACQPHATELLPNVQMLADDWRRSGHPLAGYVWRRGKWVEPSKGAGCDQHPVYHVLFDALEAIKQRNIVLLGEVHDNAGHHLLRAEILAGHTWLVTSGEGDARIPTPAAIFEHFRSDRQPLLSQTTKGLRRSQPVQAARDFLEALEWDKSGWPDRRLFEPLFAAAIGTGLPILAGDVPRDAIRSAAKDGEGTIAVEERSRLRLDPPLDVRLQDALLNDLEQSHCGLMPKTAFGNMAFAQRYRDAHLADAVLKAADTYGSAILLAGNGHVRSDRGVPLYLRQRAPERSVLTVMLIEVEDGKTDPQAYVPRDPEGKPVADFVVLTPRPARPDPCEAMRAQMKGKSR